jgi:hypothetical protein
LIGRQQNLDIGTPQDRLERYREERISVYYEEALPGQKARLAICQIPGNLFHPRRSRVLRRAGDVNPSGGNVDDE